MDLRLVLCTVTVYPLQYLGCIPHVSDWQSPSSRTEFMQMVDEGQVHYLSLSVSEIERSDSRYNRECERFL